LASVWFFSSLLKKQKIMKKLIFSMMAVALFLVPNCNNKDSEDFPKGTTKATEETVAVTGVTLNKNTMSLVTGSSETLTATVAPADATNKAVVWLSGNTAVATVNNGTVTAVYPGTAKITVITVDGSKTAECTVMVGSLLMPGESEMVSVQGGTFEMGDPNLTHTVTLSSFNVGRYPVTQKQWEAIMGTTVSQQRDKYTAQYIPTGQPIAALNGAGDNNPMYYVSWDEVQEFIVKLKATTGKNYRLATEAEWEFAARGGRQSEKYMYSGSNTIDDVAWYGGAWYGGWSTNTHPVGEKLPNELGIYDMSGNVWEWCSDWFGGYPTSAQIDPAGPSSGSYRVLRGGSNGMDASYCRVWARSYGSPISRAMNCGFRLVLQ
jgi:formylglycine-generating enzyme required for sulfatase activity